jgi:hypothetical protein
MWPVSLRAYTSCIYIYILIYALKKSQQNFQLLSCGTTIWLQQLNITFLYSSSFPFIVASTNKERDRDYSRCSAEMILRAAVILSFCEKPPIHISPRNRFSSPIVDKRILSWTSLRDLVFPWIYIASLHLDWNKIVGGGGISECSKTYEKSEDFTKPNKKHHVWYKSVEWFLWC